MISVMKRTLEQNGSWYRGFIQGKTRIVLAWIFAGLLVLSARDYPSWPGIWICFVGATLRYWASGYLRKDTRPAVGGPYAYVRNPLYLGTYLMAVGTTWAVGNPWLFMISTIVFAAIYHYIILDEETKLRVLFQSSYELYCQHVPRFWPRVWPPFAPANSKVLFEINPEPLHHRFSRELATKNKAYEAYVSFFCLVGFVSGVAFLWKHWGA